MHVQVSKLVNTERTASAKALRSIEEQGEGGCNRNLVAWRKVNQGSRRCQIAVHLAWQPMASVLYVILNPLESFVQGMPRLIYNVNKKFCGIYIMMQFAFVNKNRYFQTHSLILVLLILTSS